MAELKNEFQVEKKEPILQIKLALPNEIAENLSLMIGALNAIADAINPTRLKSIRSIKTFGSGNKNLKKRWVIKRKKPINLRT
jgi:hypothetical protein